jgi:excisionase family DNA binding protein
MAKDEDILAFARSTLGDLAHKPVIDVETCAGVLGIGRTAAYEGVRTGQIPSWRIGRRVLVPVAALVARLADCRRTKPDDQQGLETALTITRKAPP